MFGMVTSHYFILSHLHKTTSTIKILDPGQKDLLLCLSLSYCSENTFTSTFFHEWDKDTFLP